MMSSGRLCGPLSLLFVLFLHLSNASATLSALSACRAISNAVPGRVAWPLSFQYHSEIRSYWSSALHEVKPACVVRPRSVDEVSAAIKVLNKYPDVVFAAKSGGHDPNPGHATAHNGVLITMKDISGTTYDQAKKLAYVKPGGEWNDVISTLQPYNVTVVGGRLGIVGIGGYLTQGGISFLSSQYGLAADSITEWETVLPNGTIANIKAKERPDLAVAMRGSGSQFGIVTKFTIQAHPIGLNGQVWGGMRIYDANTANANQIYTALHNYVPGKADAGKSAIILSNVDAVGGITTIIMFFFYDGPNPPSTGPLADFLKIPSLIDMTSTQTYAELLKSNGMGASLVQARTSFRTFTIPYIRDRPDIYQEIAAKWKAITSPLLGQIVQLTSQCTVNFQPFPAAIGEQSQKRGGNAMGISGKDGDRLLLELQCGWSQRKDDATIYTMSRLMTDWLEVKLSEWLQGEQKNHIYLPLLMNDAMYDQNVTGMYRDYAEFKALQREIDPNGVFSSRMGGYKF